LAENIVGLLKNRENWTIGRFGRSDSLNTDRGLEFDLIVKDKRYEQYDNNLFQKTIKLLFLFV